MTLTPILSAPPIIQLHIAAALPALVLGPIALFRARRDRLHRLAGYAWAVAMLVLAGTGLFIRGGFAVVGGFGPIHLLSLITIWWVIAGIGHARRGDIAAHRATMQGLWFGAMGLAGLFTLMPGRVMNHALLGGAPAAGYGAVGAGLVLLAVLWRRRPAARRDGGQIRS